MKGPLSYTILAISLLSTTSLIFKSTSFRSNSQSLYSSSNNHKIGIIIIDHGSKKKEANEGLIKVLCVIDSALCTTYTLLILSYSCMYS